MLLLCLKPFHDLPTSLGAVGRMGLQGKTIHYILEILTLKCLWDSVRVHWEDTDRGHNRRCSYGSCCRNKELNGDVIKVN